MTAPFTYTDQQDTRSGFGAGLLELGRKNPEVVALCADLTGSLKMDAFEKEFPERFFQIGIAQHGFDLSNFQTFCFFFKIVCFHDFV